MKRTQLPIFLLMLVFWLRPESGRAQASAGDLLSETNLTVAAVSAQLTNVVSSTELNPEIKPALSNLLQQALQRLRERDALRAALVEHTQAIARATNELAAIRKALAEAPALETNGLAKMSSAELKAELAKEEAIDAAARKALEQLQAEEKRRKSRLAEIPRLIASANEKLEEIKVAAQAVTKDEPPEVTRTRRLLLSAREAYRRQEIETYEAESKAYAATAEHLAAQIAREEARAKLAAQRIARLREALAEAGRREAAAAARKAEEEQRRLREAFWQAFPELGNIATNNSALAEQLSDTTRAVAAAAEELTAREQALVKLGAEFKTARERVQAFEDARLKINQKVGRLLRESRRNLAQSVSRTVIRRRLGAITDADVSAREYLDEARDLQPIGNRVEELIQTFVARGALDTNDVEQVEMVSTRAKELMESREKSLRRLAEQKRLLAETLTKLNAADIEFDRETRAFQNFIEERVLWVRSSDLISAAAIQAELATLAGLLNPANWLGVPAVLRDGLETEPLACAIWLALTLAVFLGQTRVRHRLRAACERASSRENISLTPTWVALPLTALLAAPMPALFWAVSVMLRRAVDTTPFATSLADGLGFAAPIYFTLGFFRHAARKPGLGSDHFNWSEEDRRLVRRHLNWFLGTAVTLGFLIAFVEGDHSNDSEARLAFAGLCGALCVLSFLLLHPTRGLGVRASGRGQEAWRRARFVLSVMLPFALGVTSLIGYHFTAVELGRRLISSIWLVLGIVLFSAVLLRWFYLERKRIALSKLDLRKAGDETAGLSASEQAVAAINLTEIKEQTRSLLRVLVLISLLGGLWAIWSDITPALNILDRKALWHVEVTAEAVEAEAATTGALPGLAAGAAPAEARAEAKTESTPAVPRKVLKPVSVADVLFAVLVLVIMAIAVRNLPSFLEILILKHLKLETGGAYAITTMVQYVVVVVGIIVACASIGLSWEKVQWLAAAVTLGIGFGLQEIFANFVAGIILLFERPVRVGDVVTIGTTTGVVSRIRIRATTITNWERQELVIPNKDLITGSLTNWTLSDTVNRVVLTVGVAYGSDTRKVKEVLTEILANNKYVMSEPKPRVTFDLFGESSLNFTIRAYISSMDDRLNAIHSLHQEIDDRFREEGIEISFPQRDLHIRTGLEVLQGAQSDGSKN